jgi:dTDP-4-dehydrorhamnose 3,5-epimerase
MQLPVQDREAPVQDRQTVTPDGQSVDPRIEGVVVRYQAPVEDERGEIVEVYRPAWGVHEAPLVYVYQISILPGVVKGWVVHRRQDDRLFVVRGRLRFGLYDDRVDSPTYRMLNVLTVTDRHRALVVIPRGVYHGIENVGTDEALYLNMPTRAYDHADPDKYRLPIHNSMIPFVFERPTTR